jgi:peptidyl-prolyl cis-trans isomerase B (cyclophilin B)
MPGTLPSRAPMARHTTLTVLLCSAVLLAACGGDDSGSSAAKPATTAAPAPAAAEPASGCKRADPPAPKGEGSLKAPEQRLARNRTWTAEVTTNCGAFTIALDARRWPKTASSFAALARKGFYDGLTIHRIVPGFVIQGGDPKGDGTGGPGYAVVERPPASTRYTKGVVAMAKTGAEAPGTSGSQFYVVLGDDAGLPPEYAVVGKVTKGMDVVERIGELPLATQDPQGSPPADPVVMEKVAVGGA